MRLWISAGLAGVIAFAAAPAAKADVVVAGIPTFGGGNENITTTLGILDAINPAFIYLGSYLSASPGAVATPAGESISGTGTGTSGTVTSNTDAIYYYDVKAGSNSDLIKLSSAAGTVDWTTDWSGLLVGHGQIPDVSHIDVFGLAPVPVPEPTSVALRPREAGSGRPYALI